MKVPPKYFYASYVLNVQQNHFKKIYRAKKRTKKIRNSNVKIRNLKPIFLTRQLSLRACLDFLISDFEFRVFCPVRLIARLEH